MYRLASGSQRAGKTSRILIGSFGGGSVLTYSSWDLNYVTEQLPTTNFESWNVGFGDSLGERIHGPVEADVRFGGDWDAAFNPFGTPPGLFVRDDLAQVNLVINRFDATFWNLPWMSVLQAHNSTDVKGKVLFDVTGKTNGVFTVSSQSVAGMSGQNAAGNG